MDQMIKFKLLFNSLTHDGILLYDGICRTDIG